MKRLVKQVEMVALIGTPILLVLAGCVSKPPPPQSVIRPSYTSASVTSSQPNAGKIRLQVGDDRLRRNFVRVKYFDRAPIEVPDQGHPYIRLEPSPTEILLEGLKRALTTRGYTIADDAPVTLDVKIKSFLFDQALVFSFWGTIETKTTVGFEVAVKTQGQILGTKEITETSAETKEKSTMADRASVIGLALHGGAGDYFTALANQHLSQHLSRAIDRSMEESVLIAAIEKGQAMPVVSAPVAPLAVEPAAVRLKQFQLWQPSSQQQAWVLAVGVERYKSDSTPVLPFAVSDANRVKTWFTTAGRKPVSRDNVHMLVNEQATRENFLAQIDWLRKQALPEDAVFIYFAGHGAPELAADGKSVDAKYLLLYDTDPGQLFATGFSLDDLTRKLEAVKAKVQVVILEACYAGPVGQEILKKTPTADLEIRPRFVQEMGERGGRVILSASSGRQIAIGSDEIRGGLFTHYLLKSWADGTRRLLTDCFDDAREHVRRAANKLGSTQEPAKFGDQNVDVILGK